jgi:hypothetical protein
MSQPFVPLEVLCKATAEIRHRAIGYVFPLTDAECFDSVGVAA